MVNMNKICASGKPWTKHKVDFEKKTIQFGYRGYLLLIQDTFYEKNRQFEENNWRYIFPAIWVGKVQNKIK